MSIKTSDWLTLHKDHQLTATSPLIGSAGKWQEQWRLPTGGRVRQIETIQRCKVSGLRDLLIVEGGRIHRVEAQGKTVWNSDCAGLWLIVGVDDVDQDGRMEIVSTNGYEIHVLDAESGRTLWKWQLPTSAGVQISAIRLHPFSHMRGVQLIVGIMYLSEIAIIDWEDGAEHGRVRMVSTGDYYHPSLFVADLDQDNEDEIVVTKLCGVYQISPVTASMKRSDTWLSAGRRVRNYGLFQAVDVDKDGRLEIVIVASNVARHLTVLDNDGGGHLSLRWDRFIEMIYPTDTTEVRWVANSVSDIDGDGKPEIVVSLFNTRGDNRWWTEILDPQDGKIHAELPDAYLWDVRDVDGDGRAELLVSTCRQRTVPARGPLHVYGSKEDDCYDLNLLWQDPDARYASRSPLNLQQRAMFSSDLTLDREVWTHERGFLIWKRDDTQHQTVLRQVELSSEQDAASKILWTVPDSSACDPTPEVLAIADLDGDHVDELIVHTLNGQTFVLWPDSKKTVSISTGHAQGARLGGTGNPFTPVVWRGRDGASRVAFHDVFNRTQLWRVNSNGGMPEQIASIPGVGQSKVDGIQVSAYAADVNGDGQPEVIAARQNLATHNNQLFALDEAGCVTKTWALPETPLVDVSQRIGPYAWGLFRGHAQSEATLIVSSYRSASMNTEETFAFDAQTNTLRWHRMHVFDEEARRGFGPWSCAITQQNDDVLFLAKDVMCHINTASGDWRTPPYPLRPLTDEAAHRDPVPGMVDGFSAYGNIALYDVNQDGGNEIVVLATHGGFGVLTQQHQTLWWRVSIASDQVYRHGAIGDFDGDGKTEIVISHLDGWLRAYAGTTGDLMWTLHLGTVLADMAVCDIDGDGRVEAIGGGADGKVYAIGAGQIDWIHTIGYSLGSTVIADVNMDGRPSILIAGGDGFLHCLSLSSN
jgi:outer membrane protein assembly factor BamB